ncbi:MAG: cysteine hydrolase [Actinobacteria bacterium]|nr:cysteine hydrolase [Actinomycetota bacterium]
MERRETRRRRHDDDEGATALIVVDMLNPYDHPEAEELAERVEGALPGVEDLLRRAREADAQVVYVNDNYGDWNSSSEELARSAMNGKRPDLVEPILPIEGQSFVVKARHSTFYETPLEYLLDQMGVGRLVFCGQVTEQCILYSALDAYVRHFDVVIPTDAVAAIYDDLGDAALRLMERNMGAELVEAEAVDWG